MTVNLKSLTEHVAVATMIDSGTHSCVLGGISFGNYLIAIETGSTLEVGNEFRKKLESHFSLPVKYLFLTHIHSDHRNGIEAFNDTTLIASKLCAENMPKSTSLKNGLCKHLKRNTHLKEME